MPTHTRASTTNVVAVVIVIVSYFCSLCCIVVLCLKEYKKRKNVRILSWNGTMTDKKNQSVASESEQEYLPKSLHYFSIAIYFLAISASIGGFVRAIPSVCTWYTLAPHMLSHTFGKIFVYAFQYQRYYLCFVNDFMKKSMSSGTKSSKFVNFVVIFYVEIILVMITMVGAFIILMFATWFNLKALNSWNGIWCTWTTDDISTRISIFAHMLIYICIDWMILGLFFFTIRQLSTKMQHLSKPNLSNIQSTELDSGMSTQMSQDSNASTIDRGIEKLRWILTRIFICSILMEITYLIGMGLGGATQVGTIIWAFSYVVLATDNVINVFMINLMFQHNTDDYKRFIKRVSAIYCCKCIEQHVQYDQHVKFMQQENDHFKKKEMNAENTTMGLEETQITAVTTQAPVSTVAIDQSYFNSETSKDDTHIATAL